MRGGRGKKRTPIGWGHEKIVDGNSIEKGGGSQIEIGTPYCPPPHSPVNKQTKTKNDEKK